MKWRTSHKKTILILTMILTVASLSFIVIANHLTTKIETSVHKSLTSHRESDSATYKKLKQSPFNILILGIDTGDLGRDDKGRSDSMIIVHADLAKHTYELMSVERDFLVDIDGYQTKDKLNAAYAYGGADCAVKTIENFLDIKLPFFVSIDMGGAKNLLEQIGAINVKNDFSFSEEGFDFPEGDLKLKADQALVWARMRHEDLRGDYGRQLRQQAVLKAILNNLSKTKNITKFGEFFNLLTKNIKTNLPLKELLRNTKELLKKPDISSDQISGSTLLLDGISYEEPSDDELNRVTNKLK